MVLRHRPHERRLAARTARVHLGPMRQQQLDDVGGVPLGVLEDTRYEQSEVVLGPNQTLLLYTDGITEAMNPDGDMFGLEGIERARAVAAPVTDEIARDKKGQSSKYSRTGWRLLARAMSPKRFRNLSLPGRSP